MKNKTGTIMIILGTMLILSALFLCWYNIKENRRAYEDSQKVLVELKQLIPVVEEKDEKEEIMAEIPAVNPADDLFAPYEEKEEETPVIPEPIELDGTYYCGYITLPTLGLELPVVDGWSYAALRNSPCRYSGSAAENDIIIAAHNYNDHFGHIGDLDSGDEMIFTDTDGISHHYEVDFTQYVDGYDVDAMYRGESDDWDITLFTCTLSGQSRVTVRGLRVENEEN